MPTIGFTFQGNIKVHVHRPKFAQFDLNLP